MTLEGDVDEGLSALSSSLVDDSGTHSDLVDQQDHVSSSSDNSGVLSSNACDEQDVVAGLLDLVDSSGHTRNSLADDDSLHIGIGSHVGDGSDGLLGLGGEVIGVGSSDNDVGVGVLQVLSSLVFFLALGHGAGDDANLVASLGAIGTGLAAAGSEGQDHDQSQQHSNQSLHSFLPPKTCFPSGQMLQKQDTAKTSPNIFRRPPLYRSLKHQTDYCSKNPVFFCGFRTLSTLYMINIQISSISALCSKTLSFYPFAHF